MPKKSANYNSNPPEYKMFGDRKYTNQTAWRQKDEAYSEASKLRRDGISARVVTFVGVFGKWYIVYAYGGKVKMRW